MYLKGPSENINSLFSKLKKTQKAWISFLHTYHTLRLCSPNDWHRLFYPCPNDWTCLDCIERNFSGGSARNFHRLEWFRDQFKDKKKDYITKFQEIAEERVGPPTDKKVIVIITFTGDRTMF